MSNCNGKRSVVVELECSSSKTSLLVKLEGTIVNQAAKVAHPLSPLKKMALGVAILQQHRFFLAPVVLHLAARGHVAGHLLEGGVHASVAMKPAGGKKHSYVTPMYPSP